MLKGKDNGEISILFRDSLKDIYEDIILNNNADCHTPYDLIEILIERIAIAEAQGETKISLSPKDTLCLFEF